MEALIRVGILFADGQQLVSSAMGMVLDLEPDLHVVAAEATPTAGPLDVLAADPDVVVVDSVHLVSRFKSEHAGVRAVFVGAADEADIVLDCIRAGAVACVSKEGSPAHLADAIRRAHGGEVVYDTAILMSVLLRPGVRMNAHPRRTAKLSEREIEVLRAFAAGLSSADAAVSLGITLNTLRSHLKNILVKLEARSKLEAVLIAVREGRIELQ